MKKPAKWKYNLIETLVWVCLLGTVANIFHSLFVSKESYSPLDLAAFFCAVLFLGLVLLYVSKLYPKKLEDWIEHLKSISPEFKEKIKNLEDARSQFSDYRYEIKRNKLIEEAEKRAKGQNLLSNEDFKRECDKLDRLLHDGTISQSNYDTMLYRLEKRKA